MTLQQKSDELRITYDLLSEKLVRLRKAFAIENDPATKFKIEEQIKQTETERDQIEKQIEAMESHLKKRVSVRSRQKGRVELGVDLSRLPIPSINKLFGREQELKCLEAYLEDDNIALASIVAFAGAGKSFLVDSFLNRIAPTYGDTSRVFGWHFYSQESQDATVTSSSLFFEQALRFFGMQGELPTHDNEKARELVKLVQSQKSILILDGIEPLQHSPHIKQGHFRDRAMQIFLTAIARDGLASGGLVLVTSRQPLVEIERFTRSKKLELTGLSVDTGIDLLEYLGVKGGWKEMAETVNAYKGHALSLVLLGKMLVSDYEGDVLQRHSIDLLDSEIGSTINGILDYYDRFWSDDEPEKIFLFLLSLFNRPMQKAEFETLRSESSFALPLGKLPRNRFNRLITHLRNTGMVIVYNSTYDTHSLIRTYFAQKFERNQGENFVQCHRIMFEYFQRVPKLELPRNLEDLEPLYRAVYHGCKAKEYVSALDIYWERISRGREFFSQRKLGALSSDLFAISQFFLDGWEDPAKEWLNTDKCAWLLAVAAFLLTALGRLDEAIKPRYAEIDMFKRKQDWALAAGDSRNLIQALVPLGRLAEASAICDQAIEFADNMSRGYQASEFSKDVDTNFVFASCIGRKAMVLHLQGKLNESLEAFQEAEHLYGRRLDRTNGFYYCALLLDLAASEVELNNIWERGKYCLEISVGQSKLANIGNDNLTIANTYRKLKKYDQADLFYDEAIAMLQKSSRIERLPNALLARATFFREFWLTERDDELLHLCHIDIEEAEQIIIVSGMNLYKVDLDLLKANLLIDQGFLGDAQEMCSGILRRIRQINYGLRERDIELLQERLSTSA